MSQQWSQHVKRRTHGFHQLIGRLKALDRVRMNLNIHLFIDHNFYAKRYQQLDHGRNVAQMRDVTYRDWLVRQKCRCKHFERGVFRTRRAQLTFEHRTTFYQKSIHKLSAGLFQSLGDHRNRMNLP